MEVLFEEGWPDLFGAPLRHNAEKTNKDTKKIEKTCLILSPYPIIAWIVLSADFVSNIQVLSHTTNDGQYRTWISPLVDEVFFTIKTFLYQLS